VHEHRQDFYKGGADHPHSDDDLLHKFAANCSHGGWSTGDAQALRQRLDALCDMPRIDTAALDI
jgi:hypothetical protein